MKKSKLGLYAILFTIGSLGNLFATETESTESNVIILTIDSNDEQLQENLELNGLEAAEPQSLEELIEILDETPPLSKRQTRIDAQTTSAQVNYLSELEAFIQMPFDEKDPEGDVEFVKRRDRLVKLIFGAPTEREYYQRLYLLNKFWLEHPAEIERFTSLDLALRDSWLKIEEQRRRIQRIVMGVSTVGGIAVGGYLSYQASTKILPMAANQGTIGTVLRWAGRGSIIVVGAWVGGQAGAYLGFLGSDYVFGGSYDFVDPIDGDEDLRDILDIIESL